VRRALALVHLLALVALPCALSAAGYEEAFRDGMSALDQKKWGVADASFRAAITANPKEGGKQIRVYGTWLLDYLPHYYLGVALYQLGDVEGAAQEWHESRRQGAILSTPLVADLERWEKRLPKEPAAPPAAAKVAEKSATKPASRSVPKQPPAPEQRSVQSPSAAVAKAEPTEAGGAPPRREHLPETGEGAVPSRSAEAPAAASRSSTAPVPGAPEVVKAPASAPPTADPGQLLLPPARLYFGGRYREALATLHGLRWPGGTPPRACLLEAAAAYALFRQVGGDDPRYLEQARAALRPCPGMSRRDRPDPNLFSPAFSRWFDDNLPRP
jgi:hypothetical protein